jgi:thiamine biosynthesis lipoprotein
MAPPRLGALPTRALIRRIVGPALFVCAVAWAHCRSGPGPLDVAVLEGPTMGSTFTVKVVLPPEGRDPAPLAGSVESVLAEVDAAMSNWREDSEVERLNRHGDATAFAVGPSLARLLDVSADVHRRSDGLFDPTMAPLIARWGFGPQGAAGPAPDAAEIAGLQERVGFSRLLVWEPAARTLQKARPEVELNLAAVAPGFAADLLAEALEADGWRDYMIEIGGEVRARGTNASREPWRIAIERPDGGAVDALEVVELGTGALATSGDYRNYREEGGQRLSHTLDPRTGRPITHGLASVTVIQPTAGAADAWATALMVAGPEEGAEMARREGLPALFVVRAAGGGFRTTVSPAWEARRQSVMGADGEGRR